MKKGDKIPVAISGATVGYALVTELGNGTVTLVIPAQKVVMGVRMELDTAPVAQEPRETSTVITGVERAGDNIVEPTEPAQPVEQPVVQQTEAPPAPVEPAPVQTETKSEPVQRNVGSKWETNAGAPPDWDED